MPLFDVVKNNTHVHYNVLAKTTLLPVCWAVCLLCLQCGVGNVSIMPAEQLKEEKAGNEATGRVLAKAGKQGGVTLLFLIPPPFCMLRK